MGTATDPSREAQAAAIAGLRDQALALASDRALLARLPVDRRIIAMLMETGFEHAAYSLVATLDGGVSLYFSSGGAIIGAGERERPRTAAAEFLDCAERFLVHASPVGETPWPAAGHVIFYFVTAQGVRRYTAPERELGEQRDLLAPLFHAGHAVIAEIRALQEPP